MNLDENIKRALEAILKKWKLLVVLAIIGAIVMYVYTNQTTVLTYSSEIEFFCYTNDSETISESSSSSSSSSDSSDSSSTRISETSRMNYVMSMMDTYIELFSTNDFCQYVADSVNETYGTSIDYSTILGCVTIAEVESTTMFTCTVVTTDADLSYYIALTLGECIPSQMENTNKGLVLATVEDAPLKASTSESINYLFRCFVGAVAGILLGCVYVVVRDVLDVRIKSEAELTERYDYPILGSVPAFGTDDGKKKKKSKKSKNEGGYTYG